MPWTRKCALEANKSGIGLKDVILQQEEIKDYLTPEEVEKIMDPHTYLGSSVKIVEKVLDESKKWF
jgi:adenylosuccinate lyase